MKTFACLGILVVLSASVLAGCTSTPAPAMALVSTSAPTQTPDAASIETPDAQSATASPSANLTMDPNYSGLEMMGFGIGGSECALDQMARTFAPDDAIRMTAEYTPGLRVGTSVTIRLLRDGTQVDGYPVEVHFASETRCVFGNVSPGTLPAGHYRLEVAPDTAPTIGAEFDVVE